MRRFRVTPSAGTQLSCLERPGMFSRPPNKVGPPTRQASNRALLSLCAVDDAGDVYARAAELFRTVEEEYDAASAVADAIKAYRQGLNHDRAVSLAMDVLVPSLLESGKHGQAAKVPDNLRPQQTRKKKSGCFARSTRSWPR